MKTETEVNPSENIRKLGEMIKEIKFSMLTTVDPDGSLSSRPMAAQEVTFDGDLWFFTSRTSGKIASIRNDQHVNLSYADPKNNRYISICGKASLSDDQAKKYELWTPLLKAWFPLGVRDPEIILIKVEVNSAEFWDYTSSKLVQLIGFAKATLTGQRYTGGEGTHERFTIH